MRGLGQLFGRLQLAFGVDDFGAALALGLRLPRHRPLHLRRQIDRGEGYDLVIMLNMPPFFEPVAALVRRGGHLAHIASRGATTPFYTPEDKLRGGFGRRGLETVAAGAAGPGTYYLARRP